MAEGVAAVAGDFDIELGVGDAGGEGDGEDGLGGEACAGEERLGLLGGERGGCGGVGGDEAVEPGEGDFHWAEGYAWGGGEGGYVQDCGR